MINSNKKTYKSLIIFLTAFALNLVWENWHAQFYLHYQSGKITELILIRAAIFDAVFIFILALIFSLVPALNKKHWLALIIGVAFSIILEKYALTTNRWAYNDLMPIIPFLNTGLTPTVQLGLISYLIFIIFDQKRLFH
ncbi:MAG: hypothetical protein A2729_03200 [Candidatus Buchananbacteria bacterium RIFCSPHIGHO2_01_FULL_39_14]|uniref:Uncharacterized protein n=2 Tax=Candidatus Buchananiibacteriota TaxID=1817903 RepID=A0A1G1YQ21_9BACT|nr:MAG: hypothetical protein A2729_03200 [Candidatus Buchananbacteria bacterium RIFCSPHIGHO2_01_FULL_39_14]OGY48873.1 MAG: hypothetical protein A3D39_01100 [Candidatus Buchananbacteria bacterium RIFCSPHIGHO2_02_FULL_39_17]OGY54394.1 MAG: hypothetical protein A2912_02210 [Candidatus Buchananbacteria bacterium RIFCSPLOWO2_01_FULL_40_23b]